MASSELAEGGNVRSHACQPCSLSLRCGCILTPHAGCSATMDPQPWPSGNDRQSPAQPLFWDCIRKAGMPRHPGCHSPCSGTAVSRQACLDIPAVTLPVLQHSADALQHALVQPVGSPRGQEAAVHSCSGSSHAAASTLGRPLMPPDLHHGSAGDHHEMQQSWVTEMSSSWGMTSALVKPDQRGAGWGHAADPTLGRPYTASTLHEPCILHHFGMHYFGMGCMVQMLEMASRRCSPGRWSLSSWAAVRSLLCGVQVRLGLEDWGCTHAAEWCRCWSSKHASLQ